jgi:hypothetical protein
MSSSTMANDLTIHLMNELSQLVERHLRIAGAALSTDEVILMLLATAVSTTKMGAVIIASGASSPDWRAEGFDLFVRLTAESLARSRVDALALVEKHAASRTGALRAGR